MMREGDGCSSRSRKAARNGGEYDAGKHERKQREYAEALSSGARILVEWPKNAADTKGVAATGWDAGRGDSKGAGVRGTEDGGAGNGGERKTEEDGETKGEGDATETEERQERYHKKKRTARGARSTTASPLSLGLTHALHDTPSTQSLTFPPGRAGRERRLSGRVREVPSDMW